MENLTITRFGWGCALALAVGLLMTLPVLRQKKLGYGAMIRLSVCVIPLTWLCSRLLFVAFDLGASLFGSSFYLDTVGSAVPALYFWDGGYSLMGALLGAVLGAKLAEGWTRSGSGVLRDGLALGLPAAIAVERLLERGTGLGLGKAGTAGWPLNRGIFHDPEYAPVYLYEALIAILLLVLTGILFLRLRDREDGELLEMFLLLWGLTQALLESLRSDDHMVYHFVRVQQVTAFALAIAVMLRWTHRALRRGAKPLPMALGWVLTLAAAGAAVAAEFGVDRWGKPLLAYGLMIACLTAVGLIAFRFRSLTKRA